jgi:hypothetical protein
MCWRVGEENTAVSSALAGGELRDLGSLPVGLSYYRPCLAVHLPVRRRLWKSCVSQDLNSGPCVLPGIKQMPGCSS